MTANSTTNLSGRDLDSPDKSESELLTTITEEERPRVRARLGPMLLMVAGILLWAAIITLIAKVI
jgi:hypothetical protein